MAGNLVTQLQGWVSWTASQGSQINRTVRARAEPLLANIRETVGPTAFVGLLALAAALLSVLFVVLLGLLAAATWTMFALSIVLAVLTTTGLAVGGSGALVFASFAGTVGCAVLAGAGVLYATKQVLRHAESTFSWGVRRLHDAQPPTTTRPEPQSKDTRERDASSMYPTISTTATAAGQAGADEAQPATPPPVSTLLPTRIGGGSPPAGQYTMHKSTTSTPEPAVVAAATTTSSARQEADTTTPVPAKVQAVGSVVRQEAVPDAAAPAKLEAVLTKPLNAGAPAFQANAAPISTPLDASQTIPKPSAAPKPAVVASAAQGAAAPQQGSSQGAQGDISMAAPKEYHTPVAGAQGAAPVPSKAASRAAAAGAQQLGGAAQEGSMGVASGAAREVPTAAAGLGSAYPRVRPSAGRVAQGIKASKGDMPPNTTSTTL